MVSSFRARTARIACTAGVVSLLLAAPSAACAQAGRVSGTITESGAGPLVRAHVLIPAIGLSAQSGDDGRFTITGVPAGTHQLRIFRLGYEPVSRPGVIVTASGDAQVTAVLVRATVHLQGVVVSAARHAEKITDAAASITAINPHAFDAQIGNSYQLALRNAPGLDVTQVGITSVFVNGRGFNNRFNTRWLTLEDGRIASLAETGLPIGEHTTIPKLDVASMEVVNGPGSALYGANASSGLLSVQTKDPRAYPGLSVELAGGSRELRDVQARYAGTRGNWGYKIAGEHQAANDFTNLIYYPAITAGGKPLPETIADFRTSVDRVSGSLVYYLAGGSKVQLNSGFSLRNGLGDSNSGHYQIKDYTYSDYQLLYSGARWFAQAYVTHSNSGNTGQLYAFVPLAARSPHLTRDSVWQATRFHVDGRIYAAELQNNFLVGSLARTGLRALDNTLVTWGAQLKRVRVSSYETVFYDVLTRRPIELNNNGAYVQLESQLSSTLRTVIAGRYDAASRYAPQFSPRASLLYTPKADQTVRVTYGEAYRSPPILSTEVYNTPNATTRNLGNSRGFIIKNANGVVVSTIGRMLPETNKTWELGYKAVLARRLFVDVTGWHSTFVNFISGGLLIADPFGAAKTSAYDPATGALWADAAGKAVQVRTNFNLGEGVADGIDAAFRYYLTDRFALASTMSFTRLDTIKTKPTDPKDAGQFNTSSNRMSVSFESTDLPKNVNASATLRYVNGYMFRSAIVWGQVPMYSMLDLSVSYRIPRLATTFTVQGQNLAACVGGTSTPPVTGFSSTAMSTYTKGTKCGFGQPHLELLSMPALGPVVIVGVRKEWR